MKKLSMFILGMLVVFIASPVYAQTMNLKLAPNQSKVIENNYLWSLNATCTVQCNETSNKILIKVVKSTGSVNGQNLANGQVKSVTIHNHDSISVSAEPGAKVTLVNKGDDEVKASCSG